MESEKIKCLDQVIKKFHGQDIQIVDTKLTNLTAPGENYMSDMLKLDVTIRNKNGTENIEHYVAKCVLLNPGFPPEMSTFIFKNEILFYTVIIPTIQQFAKEQGLPEKDIFPEIIAGRLNLEGKDEPDVNALLIMENLTEEGYENADRHKSFDLAGAKLILSDLATFHAVPLAMKILNFELFEKKIAENCKRPAPPPPPPPSEDSEKDQMKPPNPINVLRQVAKEDEFCRTHIKKLEKLMASMEELMKEKWQAKPDYSSPFCTLCHNDMWLNNTMQLTNDGQIIKNKFVDFQICSLDDPTVDLIFFLFSSVDLPTLENHLDYLLMFYHECFIKILEHCKCDVTPFAYAKFMIKIKDAVRSTFLQIIIMMFMVIYAKKGEKSDFSKIEEFKSSDLHPIAKKKFIFLFRKIIENDWF